MQAVLEATQEFEAVEPSEQVLFGVEAEGTATLEARQAKGTAKFDVVAYTGGDLMVALYDVPAVVDLKGLQASESWPMLLDHKKDKRVGHTSDVINNGRTLRHKGHASVPGPHSEFVVEAARKDFPWQVSIGVMPLEAVRVPAGQTFEANGRTFEGPRVWVKRSKMNETSFVSVGGDVGGASATLTAEQQIQAFREAQAAESKRVASIKQVCAEFAGATIDVAGEAKPLEAHAIETGMEPLEAELAAWRWKGERIREERGTPPSVHMRTSSRGLKRDTLEAALMLRSGVDIESDLFTSRAAHLAGIPRWLRAGINDDVRQRVLEETTPLADRSLMALAEYAVQIDGQDPVRGRRNMLEAAFSGSTLGHIFSTSINAKVLQSYREAPDTSRQWTREVEVNDFRRQEAFRLTEGGNELQLLPRGGEIQDATANDTGEGYRIARYAKGWTIDEQDVIDDRFDLLNQKPEQMARAAARLRPDMVYAELLSNPVMGDGVQLFQEDHGNVLTYNDGTPVVNPELSARSLEAAKVQLSMMQEEGVTLDLSPTGILLPPAMEFLAKQLLESPEIRGDGAANGTRNAVYQMLQSIIPEARLANGVRHPKTGDFVAGSTTGFYIFDANALDFRVAYRSGTGRAPRLRSQRFTDTRYGFRFEVDLDIGVKAVTTKPILRSNGS